MDTWFISGLVVTFYMVNLTYLPTTLNMYTDKRMLYNIYLGRMGIESKK